MKNEPAHTERIPAATGHQSARVEHQWLLRCGPISSLLYAVVNVIVPLQWPAYSIADPTVSELSAVGAPTRILWVVLCVPFTMLTIAFAYGVWKSGALNRRIRITGILLIFYGILGAFWPFFPMHLREALAAGGSTISDTLHIALAAITELIFFAALILAALALDKTFRIYSWITLLVFLIFGILTFLDAPAISAGLPTPWMGVWERVNIGVFLLWMTVLAMQLLRAGKHPAGS